jgi:hypothetical protein
MQSLRSGRSTGCLFNHGNFVYSFKLHYSGFGILHKAATYTNIIDRATAMKVVYLTDPIPPVLDRIMTQPETELQRIDKAELREIVSKEDEIVTLEIPRDGCRFSFRNETKWPITRIQIGYGLSDATTRTFYHDFDPPLAPGLSSNSLVVEGATPGLCFQPRSVTSVYAAGRSSFSPISRYDLQQAKEKLAKLADAKSQIAPKLHEILDWLRSIH